jgi:protein gp37
MGTNTAIEWTDHTWNPFWGCQEVSPECQHCYARTLAERWGFHLWGGKATPRRMLSERVWNAPLKWNQRAQAEGRRSRVFTASMADVFEDHPALPPVRARMWPLLEATPWLDWQVLTKRPEHILAMVPPGWLDAWPANVWIGASTGLQEQATLRMVWMAEVWERAHPPVIFSSAEPLLGPVDFTALPELPPQRVAQLLRGTHAKAEAAALTERWHALWSRYSMLQARVRTLNVLQPRILDWVIAGGESGADARPLDLAWVRSVRDQCQTTGAAFFFKQVGGRTPKAGGRLLDGQTYDAFPTPRATLTHLPATVRPAA